MRGKKITWRFFPSTFNNSILPKSTYPLTIHVGRKEMRREWEKNSKRRELGRNKWMSPHWKSFHSEEIFWEKEIKLKPSPCLPNLSHCRPVRLSRALLTDRGDTARGRGASAHWLVSSQSAPCFQLHLHLRDSVLGVGPHTSLPTPHVTQPRAKYAHAYSQFVGTHERTNVYLFCICCRAKPFVFKILIAETNYKLKLRKCIILYLRSPWNTIWNEETEGWVLAVKALQQLVGELMPRGLLISFPCGYR